MALPHSASMRRRLAALTEAARRAVEYREELRDLSKACATVRAAVAEANIDAAEISALRRIDYPERALAERGDCPELQQADSAFVAQDPGLASRKSYTERWAQRAPSFCGQPPPNPGASLEDWYAWSLAARSEQQSDPR